MAARSILFKTVSLLVIFVMLLANFNLVQGQDGGPGTPTGTPQAQVTDSPGPTEPVETVEPPATTPTQTPPVTTVIPPAPAETAIPTGAPPAPAGALPASFSISGKVTDEAGQGLAGVEVSDGQGHHVQTDKSGLYSIDGLATGNYQVRATLSEVELIPYLRVVHLLDENMNGVDFYPRMQSQPEYTNSQPLPVNHPPMLADNPQSAGGEIESQAVNNVGKPGTVYAWDATWQVGITDSPYAVETDDAIAHLNAPTALTVDAAGHFWEAEEHGNRMVFFDYVTPASSKKIGDLPGVSEMGDYSYNSLMAVALQPHTNYLWAGDTTRLVQYDLAEDSPNQYMQMFPPSYSGGSDDGHFSEVRGIAFNVDGTEMYVADRFNQRIQVFSVATSGAVAPTYQRSLGVTGVAGDDDLHFNQPWHITYYDGYLYVADSRNHRIQKCPIAGGSCSTVAGAGFAGFELKQLNTPTAVAVTATKMYITDSYNQRVVVCDFDGSATSSCDVFAGVTGEPGSDAAHLRWPADVVVQGSHVLVADRDNQRVLNFNETGTYPAGLAHQFGATGVPYIYDATHLNTPWGIVIDTSDDSLYVAEDWGYSLAKYYTSGTLSGTLAWRVPANAGNYGSDLHHFGNFSGSNHGDLAVDSHHHIYVPDSGNNRVMVYLPDGSLFGQIGTDQGSGPYQFSCPSGVGVSNSFIFVADTCNQRVQIFDFNFHYVGTIGQTGLAGTDGSHFFNPVSVAVNVATGDIFIVDQGNQRVQRCLWDSIHHSSTCVPFAGVTGDIGSRSSRYLNHPVSVMVDNPNKRVLISDEDNSRVQVFGVDGAYLTTIAGTAMRASDGVYTPAGLAVDSLGAVYLADRQLERIHRFTVGVPDWTQINVNGFGEQVNGTITGLTYAKVMYKNVPTTLLYALTYSSGGNLVSPEVWRRLPDDTWQAVSAPGFGNTGNIQLTDANYYKSNLYVGTYNDIDGGELWRCKAMSPGVACEKPSDWNPVTLSAAINSNFKAVTRMVRFQNLLIVSFMNQFNGSGGSDTEGGQLWSYDGDTNSWNGPLLTLDATTTGIGRPIMGIYSLAVSGSGDVLYAGTNDWISSSPAPAQLYRCTWAAGSCTWDRVKSDGITDSHNLGITSLVTSPDGYLYVGTTNQQFGGMIYRYDSSLAGDNVVVDHGFVTPTNFSVDAMIANSDGVYAVMGNYAGQGMVLIYSPSGDAGTWTLFSSNPGFGTSGNVNAASDSSMLFSQDEHLMVGTSNNANGGQLWLNTPSSASSYHIAGQVNYTGPALTAINVILQPVGRTTHPDSSGNYIFDNLLPGGYTVTAEYDFLSFTPPVQPETITLASVDDVNFTAASGGIDLSQPPDGTQLPSLDPVTLVWTAYAGVTSYTLQVSNNATFSPLLKSATQATTSFKLAGLSSGKTYYWKVRKANSPAGAWSAPFTFITPVLGPPASPVLQGPLNGAALAPGLLKPSFTWKASVVPAGGKPVLHYHIQLLRQNTSVILDIDEYTPDAATTFIPTANLTPNQVYYWRVRAFNTSGDASAWSATFSFKVKPLLPLTAWAYDENTLRPGFHWTDPYCTGKYLLQVYKVTSTLQLVKSATVTSGAACEGDYKLTGSLAVNTKYEWRLTTQGSNGSSLPLINTFTTPLSVPGTPVLVGPAANLIIPDTATYPDWQPIFAWQAVDTHLRQHYEIQIAGQPGFGSSTLVNAVVDKGQTTTAQGSTPSPYDSSTYLMETPLPYNATVYWRVRTCIDSCSIWSDARKLITRPGKPTHLTYSGNSVDTTFQWTDPGAYTHFANSYSVAIYSDPPACTTVLKTLTSTITSTHLLLTAGKNYCMKVRGVGPSSSITGEYSDLLFFSAVAAPPVPVQILPLDKALIKTDVGGYSPYQVDFSWKASPPPSPDDEVVYNLQVSTLTDFSDCNYVDDGQASPSATRYLTAGKWYWRVRAKVWGVYSLWSPVRSFTTPGQISGLVFGEHAGVLAGVTVTVSGVSGSTTTNSQGYFYFANLPAGTRTLTLSKPGWLTQTRLVTVANATAFFEQFVLLETAGIGDGFLRIVLTWNPDNFRALEGSLWLPQATPLHVFFPTVGKKDLNAFPNAFISEDDSQRGIEIIELKPAAGRYTFAVNQIKPASSSWNGASAKVEVYSGGTSLSLLKSCSQPSGSGSWWYAFDFDGASVTCKNSMRSAAPAPYPDAPITGRVFADNSHHPLSNVYIDYGFGGTATDQNGFYSIPGIVNGNYTLTPSSGLPIYSFSPASALDVLAGSAGVDFFASPVSTPGKLSTVTIQGDYAYLGGEGWFYIVNVHDKHHPSEVGRLWIDTKSITSIVVSGVYVYILSDYLGNNEVNVVDVSDPAHPEWVSCELNSNSPFNLAAYGDYIIASAGRYVYIYRPNATSTPPSLTRITTLDLGKDWAAEWVAVSGHYAYVVGWPYGLDVYDISDPAHPAGPWHYTTPASYYNLVVDGQYAYLGDDSAEANGKVVILNVADPAHIYQVSSLPVQSYRLEKAGNFLYIVQPDYMNRLVILNVSDPVNPFQTLYFPFSGPTVDVRVEENYAFVIDADGPAGNLNILDITDQDAPFLVSSYTPDP